MDGQPTRIAELDQSFKRDVLAHEAAGDINACFDCMTCTAGCPLHAVDPQHDPRKIARMVNLGMKRRVLSSPHIWYCSRCGLCEQRCPQNVRFYSALDVLRDMAAKEGYPPPVSIDEDRCSGCGICVATCPYQALELRIGNGKSVVRPVPTLCKGCGACGAACPAGAISMNHFEDGQILAELEGFMAQAAEEQGQP